MTLPNLPQTILTADETQLYATIGKRFRRRRAIESAILWTAGCSAPMFALALVMAVAR